jgi:hypothetical protein
VGASPDAHSGVLIITKLSLCEVVRMHGCGEGESKEWRTSPGLECLETLS